MKHNMRGESKLVVLIQFVQNSYPSICLFVAGMTWPIFDQLSNLIHKCSLLKCQYKFHKKKGVSCNKMWMKDNFCKIMTFVYIHNFLILYYVYKLVLYFITYFFFLNRGCCLFINVPCYALSLTLHSPVFFFSKKKKTKKKNSQNNHVAEKLEFID